MTRDDMQEAVRIVAATIEAGLMRDQILPEEWHYCNEDGNYKFVQHRDEGAGLDGWRADFAQERARNIVQALLGEFEMKRLPPLEPCAHARRSFELSYGEHVSYCLDCGKEIDE